MSISQTTARLVGIKSGNRCAKTGCNEPLTEAATALDPEVIVGQIAHIVSQADDGPRADPTIPQPERDAEPNLVLLCPKHHRIADRQENTYTVEEMRRWKAEQERTLKVQMDAIACTVTFRELELVAMPSLLLRCRAPLGSR